MTKSEVVEAINRFREKTGIKPEWAYVGLCTWHELFEELGLEITWDTEVFFVIDGVEIYTDFAEREGVIRFGCALYSDN